MISIPIFIVAVLIAFVAGGFVDHMIEQKVRSAAGAIAAGVKTAVQDLKK